MRHIDARNMDAAYEQKLLEEFRTAAFGDFCQTLPFVTFEGTSEPQKIWMEAIQQAGGTWTLTRCSSKLDAGDNDIVSQIIADQGITFFDAIKQLAEFEHNSYQNGSVPANEDEEATLGDLYFRPFAIREGIAFNATEGTPVQTHKGHLPANDEFTVKMRRDVREAWNAKQRAFRLPHFDISRRLRTVNDGLSAEELKKFLRTKESLPQYVRLFEQFLSEYRDSAAKNFRYGVVGVDNVHTELEECIDKFPSNSFPAKEDLRENAAKMYVYFTLQQLQAGYHTAKNENNNASGYLEERVMPKLGELENYYKRRTNAVLPPAASMAKLIMQDDPVIEGHPPADILENYTVLCEWQKTMETGQILPNAKLPATLPLGHYIPLQYDKKALKTDQKTLKLAEDIVEISIQYERLLQAYQEWLASGCKDKRTFERMSADLEEGGLHNKLESLIDKLPYNDIIDKDALVEMTCRFWIGVELWQLKEKQIEDAKKVEDHLETLVRYHARRMKLTKSTRQSRDFKNKFYQESLDVINDPTKKTPSAPEAEFKEWQDNLTEFVAAFKNDSATPKVKAVAKPKGSTITS